MPNGRMGLKLVFISLLLFCTLTGTIGVSKAHVLIIGDSTSDNPTSYQETTQLAADLRQKGYYVLDYYRNDATTENILKGMYGADAVIYAGHGGYQFGNYDGAGGPASAPFALVGYDDCIWGIGGQMMEGWYGDLFTAPFKADIPVFLLHSCFSTGWVGTNQVANPIETIYNFANMFNGAGANYYATAYGPQIIYDFLNGSPNFQDVNNLNYEKITTCNPYNGLQVWRNNNGYTAFVGNWNGKFPSSSQTTPYDESAADAWYHSNRQIAKTLYVNNNIGNDAWDGTSSTFISGTKGPKKTISATLNALLLGGTINVASGTYHENLIINQKTNLAGSGKNTIITPLNFQTPIINITSGASDSSISGFVINGAPTSPALAINGASSCTITQNNITGNQIGILILGNNNNVYSNVISNNHDGVYLANKTVGNNINGNQIEGSRSNGVYCEDGTNQTIKNNTLTQGSSGVTVKNSKNIKIENNEIKNNTNTGVSLKNSSNTTITQNSITSNPEGIYISENSQDNTVSDNKINNNQNTGINIQDSQKNNINNNNIQNNIQTGIKLNQSTGNTINNLNTITSSKVGVDLENNSNQNIVTGNTIFANTLLINISNSSGNTIYNNQVNLFIIDPSHNALNVPQNKVIKVNFIVPVLWGDFWIELKNISGGVITTTKSIKGNVLTITPSSLLEANTKYFVCLHTGCVKDYAGNPIAGVFKTFITTPDAIAPTVTTSDPANNAVNIARNTAIKVTFSEPVLWGNWWVELKNTSGTLIPITKSITGNILTITPSVLLAPNVKYMICLHSGCVKDNAGNLLVGVARSFTTTDTIAPTVTTSDPTNNAVNIVRNKVIKITFSEPVKWNNWWIELKNTNGAVITITKSITINILTIYPSALLAPNTKYTICLHTGCVKDYVGNSLVGMVMTFTTGIS